jgi:hypothetical protein
LESKSNSKKGNHVMTDRAFKPYKLAATADIATTALVNAKSVPGGRFALPATGTGCTVQPIHAYEIDGVVERFTPVDVAPVALLPGQSTAIDAAMFGWGKLGFVITVGTPQPIIAGGLT